MRPFLYLAFVLSVGQAMIQIMTSKQEGSISDMPPLSVFGNEILCTNRTVSLASDGGERPLLPRNTPQVIISVSFLHLIKPT